MTKRRIDFRHVLLGCFSFVMVATLAFFLAKNIFHSNAESFNPGNIISDAAMRDYRSLSESDIQNFLKSKNSCDDRNLPKTGNNVNYLSENSPYSWHVKDGHYVCMADETFNGGTAAHIIYQAAQDYHINPKVLIVLLEKEQSLVRDTFPNSVQYRSATGFGCPDTAACDSKYYGLNNQIRNAASMFNDVLNGGWTNYPVGNNYIQYNPNSNCGGSNVYIQNLATSALYRYTPYQPGGDASKNCAAYGNINFYNFYTNWFGSTQQVFSAFDLDNIYLPDGTYNIVTVNGKYALDVANYGTTNGTNIQIGDYSDNPAQKFNIKRGSDGFYTISSTLSGKVLDISNGSVLPGANIQLYTSNQSCAQKWAIKYDSNHHYVFRSACSGNAIDVSGGNINTPGTNVQAYTTNNTTAQEWDLISLDAATISNGEYTILSRAGLAIDIAGGSKSNGANVQIYSNNGSAAQVMKITRLADGYYTIANSASGKVFDVASASKSNGANIQIYTSNQSCAQKWVIGKKNNGIYSIRNACSGNALDISSGLIGSNGANIQSYAYNGTNAQLFIFREANYVDADLSGSYYLQTSGNLDLDIAGGSKSNGANIQIYTPNKTVAQVFSLSRTSDGYYFIINPNSGKALDVAGASKSNGANVQLYTSNKTCAQKWFVFGLGDNKYNIINVCSGKALDVNSGLVGSKGANVQIYNINDTAAQSWKLQPVK